MNVRIGFHWAASTLLRCQISCGLCGLFPPPRRFGYLQSEGLVPTLPTSGDHPSSIMVDFRMESTPIPLVEVFTSPWVIVPLSVAGAIATFVTLLWVMWIIGGLFFTKPKVRLEFTKENGTDGTPLLMCIFYNDPLSQWPFSFLNVKKQNIDEFSPSANLWDASGFVCDLNVALHDSEGKHSAVLPLPCSIYGLRWAMVAFDDVGPNVRNAEGILTYLEPGTHQIRIFIHADEVDVRVMAHGFIARENANVFEWVGDPYRIRPENRLVRGIRWLLRPSP